ncbi:hypothetical protein GCM10009663_52910 [Kitasatospora arboriphila]|uniref:DUF397 domain-containing protein n=1 Tax=Kitasatospora arboriphila TaxID=258052 RepID=A0ABP4EGC5_9ACTN
MSSRPSAESYLLELRIVPRALAAPVIPAAAAADATDGRPGKWRAPAVVASDGASFAVPHQARQFTAERKGPDGSQQQVDDLVAA